MKCLFREWSSGEATACDKLKIEATRCHGKAKQGLTEPWLHCTCTSLAELTCRLARILSRLYLTYNILSVRDRRHGWFLSWIESDNSYEAVKEIDRTVRECRFMRPWRSLGRWVQSVSCYNSSCELLLLFVTHAAHLSRHSQAEMAKNVVVWLWLTQYDWGHWGKGQSTQKWRSLSPILSARKEYNHSDNTPQCHWWLMRVQTWTNLQGDNNKSCAPIRKRRNDSCRVLPCMSRPFFHHRSQAIKMPHAHDL